MASETPGEAGQSGDGGPPEGGVPSRDGDPSDSGGGSGDTEPRDGTSGAAPGDPRLRLAFRSDALAGPFRDRFDEGIEIEVDPVVPLADGTHLQYWTVTGVCPETLCETAATFPTVADARLLRTVDETHQVEVHGTEESLFSAFDAFGGVHRSATYDDRGVRIVAEFPPSVEIDALVETVREVYPDLELYASRKVRTETTSRHRVRERLTERQLTALQLAYFGGYYEQPRRSTGEQLADRMGVSRQTFHEHLWKAYATVFEQLLDAD